MASLHDDDDDDDDLFYYMYILQTTFYYPIVASPDQFCDYLLHGTSAAATHTSLHWGSTWNMHTPLENLESGENSFDDACMSSV